MKFLQQNKIVRTKNSNTSYFIREITDTHGNLIEYKFLGQTPILRRDPFHKEFEEFRRAGSIGQAIMRSWL